MQEVKNTIELNIYNEDLEVKKTYLSYGLRWKTFKAIMANDKKYEEVDQNNPDEVSDMIEEVVRMVFPNISNEDMEEAYYSDLENCFNQAMNLKHKMAKN